MSDDERQVDDDIHAVGVIPCHTDIRVERGRDMDPTAPESERLDVEATNRARRIANELVGGVWGASVREIFAPTPEQVAAYGELTRAERTDTKICHNCAAFDLERGHGLMLDGKGAAAVMRGFGSHVLRRLGDPREYGVCRQAEGLKLAHRLSPCATPDLFRPRGSTFGRLLGGVWRRIGEL